MLGRNVGERWCQTGLFDAVALLRLIEQPLDVVSNFISQTASKGDVALSEFSFRL